MTPTRTSRPRSSAIRILHVRNTCGYYGAERCIVSWVAEARRRGHGSSLAYFPHADPSVSDFITDLRAAGVASVHALRRSHRHLPDTVRALSHVVRAEGVDVIHAHENRGHLVGGLVGRITQRPVVGTLHGYVETGVKSRLWARVNERLLGTGWLSAVTVPTRVLSRRLPRAHWVPNALSATRAEGALAALTPPATPTFGVVARLSREKGVHVFLEAIQDLPPEWRFLVIGTGAEEGRLQRHAAAGRVNWMGFRPDAAERMRTFTALVVPSLSEGLPITVLEAAAQGVPLVASAVGGVPEVVEAGVTGLLVAAGDARALGKAMQHVVTDGEGARRRAEAARKRFLEAHTLERTGAALESLYERLLERPI